MGFNHVTRATNATHPPKFRHEEDYLTVRLSQNPLFRSLHISRVPNIKKCHTIYTYTSQYNWTICYTLGLSTPLPSFPTSVTMKHINHTSFLISHLYPRISPYLWLPLLWTPSLIWFCSTTFLAPLLLLTVRVVETVYYSHQYDQENESWYASLLNSSNPEVGQGARPPYFVHCYLIIYRRSCWHRFPGLVEVEMRIVVTPLRRHANDSRLVNTLSDHALLHPLVRGSDL